MKPRAGVVAAHVQNDGALFVQQRRYKAAHLRGRIGGLVLEADGHARAFQQALHITGAHQGLRLIQIEEGHRFSLRCRLKRPVDGQLGFTAAGLPRNTAMRRAGSGT